MTTRPLLPYPPVIGRSIDARAVAHDAYRALPLSGKSVALLLSVSAHVAVGVALARGAHQVTSQALPQGRALVEIAAVDLVADAPAEPVQSQPATVSDSRAHPLTSRHDPQPIGAAARPSPLAPNAGDPAPLAAAAVIDSPAPAAPHFVMTVGATSHTAREAATADSRVGTPGSGVAEPLPEAAVDTAAKLLAGNSPSYTPEAEAAGVEADVPLEIVVDGAGAVIAARVLSHVGYGLDEAALRGVRAYRFSPARRAGKALAVRMRWLMRFQLR